MLVEGVVLAAAVTVQVLLDAAAAPVQRVTSEADHVEGVHDRGGVGQLFGGGGLEAGEPVHRDDVQLLAPGLRALGSARRTLHTGSDLLTDRQQQRLNALFGVEDHVQIEATWGIYQRMIGAYREPDRSRGRHLMTELIHALSRGVPAALIELIMLGRTLTKRADDVLAYFDRPGTSNGPTEAINGRLEHLRGSARGFRNLTNYIARSLLETGGFRPRLHPQL